MTDAKGDPSDDATSSDGDPVEIDTDTDTDERDLDDLINEFLESEGITDDRPSENRSAEEVLSDTIGTLERVTSERDEYLDLARRVQAEFENYKRRVEGQRIEQVKRAAEDLVVEILPVLDACEAAIAHGAEDVGPIQSALFGTLEKRGLTRVDDTEVSFDPLVHEAVLTEEGDGNDGEPLVTEIMRTGYSWNGRVVRPAMVKVRG